MPSPAAVHEPPPSIRSHHRLVKGSRHVHVWDTASLPFSAEERHPDRTTFVLLHGLGIGALLFGPVTERLAAHGRVLVIDLPGYNLLPMPAERMSISDYADAVVEILETMQVRRPVVVGHSMGAQIAAEIARRHPARGGRTVLVSPCLPMRLRTVPRMLAAFGRSSVHERLRPALVSVLGYVRSNILWSLATVPAVAHYPIDEGLEGVGGRLEIVHGDADVLCPHPWALELLKGSGAEGSVRVARGAAHQVVIDHVDVTVEAALEAAR